MRSMATKGDPVPVRSVMEPNHVTVKIHAMAVAKRAVPARARFWMERIHAKGAAKKAVRPGVMAVDRTGEAIRCAMAGRKFAVIHCVTDDLLPDSPHGLGLNVVCQPNRATGCFARFPASSALAREFDQPFDTRFHAADGRGEPPVRQIGRAHV